MTNTFWHLNDLEYFEAPGLSALIFHDFYPEGKQGGIEIIQHDERVAACGDVRIAPAPGQWAKLPQVGDGDGSPRAVDAETGEVCVPGRFTDPDVAYTVCVRPAGEALRVTVNLTTPVPQAWAGKVGFNLELFPGAYFGRAFHLGGAARVFPRQSNGPVHRDADGRAVLIPLARGPRLVAAPEDALRRLTVTSETGELALYDGRDTAQNGWFVLREVFDAASEAGAIVWTIRPHSVPGWRREPVIGISQVGYHPDQDKRAILELDPRVEALDPVFVQRLAPDGGLEDVLEVTPTRWGRFLRYAYAIADFTAVREPGLYRVRYGERVTLPFAIDPEVYRHDVWQPTLETYFPVQMCHVEVRDRYRVWHGACHLDDALQAPAPHEHFDGYRQGPKTETHYAPYEHIPHLDQGGWHDAGDYDLAAGSQARTTHTLALIREIFGVDTDQTTVDQAARRVLLHTPDGVPDIVEQVAHGVLNLLSGYRAAGRAAGHSFHGIIANSLDRYVHLGDASTMTDNRVYDPTLAPGQVQGEFSGAMDDRWAFTNHDTALEYLVARALAAASRVLRGYEEALADECLTTAVRVWEYEQAHPPVEQRGSYVPRDPEVQEVGAAVELLLTTGEARYRDRLLALWPTIAANVARVGPTVARARPALDDADVARDVHDALAVAQAEPADSPADNPFGVPFQPHIWGVGWQLLNYAMGRFHVWRAFPDLVDREQVLRVLNYVLGCHPSSNTSLASGVGARSLTVAYGVNRADGAYIPGGVPAGPALIRPDFPELKEPWPYLWQQTEYVMSGAANYIFCVLAADHLLNAET